MTTSQSNGALTRREFMRGVVGAAIGASLMSSPFLAGCGGGSEEPGSTQSVTPTIKATVDGDLEVFGFAEFLDPKLIESFEKEYGVKVTQNYFDSDQTMVQKLASGVPYDLVMSVSTYLPSMIASSLLLPIDHAELKNWDQVVAFYQDPPYDPGAQYSLPYADGPSGIAWNTERIDSATMTGSYDDLWNHPGAAGKIFLLDQMIEGLGCSLLRLGYPLTTSDSGQLDEAADQLIELKGSLGGITMDDYGVLSRGQAWLAQAYSGSVYYALLQMESKDALSFETCKEGVMMGATNLSIGANAKHPGTAMLFLDWMLDPEHATQNVQFTGYPNGTTAGIEAFNELMTDYPFLQQTTDMLEQGLWKVAPTGETKRAWEAAWRKVKTA